MKDKGKLMSNLMKIYFSFTAVEMLIENNPCFFWCELCFHNEMFYEVKSKISGARWGLFTTEVYTTFRAMERSDG